jgi:hypothetical protein
MAFDKTRLVLIEGAGKLPYYKYETADAVSVVDTAGYFNEAVAILPIGTAILVISVDDLSAPTLVNAAGHLFVNSNDGSTIDVVDLTGFAATDTD